MVGGHYRIQTGGRAGAVAGVTGTVLPTTLLMLLMGAFFFRVKDSAAVRAMLKTVRPVVVGLLLWTAYDIAAAVLQAKKIGWSATLAAAVFGFIVYR